VTFTNRVHFGIPSGEVSSPFMDAKRIQRILRQHLRTDQLLGVEAVAVGTRRESLAMVNASVAYAGPEPIAADAAPPASDFTRGASEPAMADMLPPKPAAEVLFTPPRGPRIERAAKVELLQAMDANEVKNCNACRLCEGRTQTVFGEGDPDAEILFIGEGPGQTEDELGRPFVGAAGELLDKMIVAMGLQREQVYIANVVKCRPPNNRAPQPDEVAACRGYLMRQIETIQPKVIVTLGGPATKLILETEKGITMLRGTWGKFRGWGPVPVMPTFHPSYVLRTYTADTRGKVWSDLKKVVAFLKSE
jgi:uracil-DNA glycosylase family 4